MDPNSNPFNAPAPAPAAPQPAAMPQPVMPQPKKSKLGLILGLSFGGGLLLIGIIVLVLVLVLGGGVSQQDRMDASLKSSDMATAYSKMSSFYISTSSTETQIKNELDNLQKGRANFDSELTELGKMKAVKNDKKAQELYKSITDKKSNFDSTMDVVVEMYKEIYPAISKMSGSYATTNYNDRVKAMQSAVDSIGELKMEVNKKLVSDMKGILTKMATAAARVQAGRDDYTKYDSNASSEWYDLTDKWQDAISDWQSDIEKQTDNAELKDQINSLNRYLNDQLLNKR